jgi:hypothetical protein
MFGDQVDAELVAAAQYAEDDVFAADVVVFVRQGFSERELQRLLGRLGERNAPATTPAPAGLGRCVVECAQAEGSIYFVADRSQIDPDQPQRICIGLKRGVSRGLRDRQPIANHADCRCR